LGEQKNNDSWAIASCRGHCQLYPQPPSWNWITNHKNPLSRAWVGFNVSLLKMLQKMDKRSLILILSQCEHGKHVPLGKKSAFNDRLISGSFESIVEHFGGAGAVFVDIKTPHDCDEQSMFGAIDTDNQRIITLHGGSGHHEGAVGIPLFTYLLQQLLIEKCNTIIDDEDVKRRDGRTELTTGWKYSRWSRYNRHPANSLGHRQPSKQTDPHQACLN
jgi:hypothetical protein